MKHDFTCPACGSHQFYVDANSHTQPFPIRYCVKCDSTMTAESATIDVVPVNHNEITTIADIAINYLVGRKMVITGQNVYIDKVWRTKDSRMCLTVSLQNGMTKHLYLPTKIELLPLEVQNAEQD